MSGNGGGGRGLKDLGVLLMTLGAVVVGLSLLQRVVSSVSPSSATTSTDQLAFQSEIVSLKHAQAAIPKALDAIYASLDQGDPTAATRYLSPKITSSTDALDFICRPFYPPCPLR